jgi:hypothetical protein
MAVAVEGWRKAAVAGRRVAVAGCSWHSWKEEVGAVRMVPVRGW